MSKFLIRFSYSHGSWARMMKVTDDRTTAVRTLVESLSGSLDAMYWDMQDCASFVLAELPDVVSAVAVMTAATKTGAFIGAEAHELLTEDQMHSALTLAKYAANFYDPPGSAAIELPMRFGMDDPDSGESPGLSKGTRTCRADPARQSRQIVVARVADRGGAVGRACLGEDPVDVTLDSVRADIQLGGDGRVGHALGDH